jgi:hypothetical protein
MREADRDRAAQDLGPDEPMAGRCDPVSPNLAARVPGLARFAVPAVLGLVPLILEPLVGLVIALVGSVRPLGSLDA